MQKARVDYDEGALTLDTCTRRCRKPRLFVMTLGFSRCAFRKVVWHSSKPVSCELHEEPSAYFYGAPQMLRVDCLKQGVLKQGVLKPDIYEFELNAP
jgi:transposase